MADRIKGITIEIGGDTTGLSKALKGVNSELKNAENGLKDVDKLLKLDPGNVELLQQKQQYLNDAISASKEKLEQEKQALEQMKNSDGFDKNSEQAKALERQIIADEQELKNLQSEAKKFGSVGVQQFKLVGEKIQSVGKSITKVGKGLSKYVTAPIVAVGAASMAAFKEVDNGLDIIVTKTGATGEALDSLEESYERIATSIPTDFETAGTAIGEVNTRFHLTGQELENLTGQFIKFSIINGTDVNSSIDMTQKVLAAFNLTTEDAVGLLDTLNKVGQDTGAGMDSMLSGLVTNAAAFQEMGLTVEEAATLMGQLEVSGADVNTVLGGLQKALKNAHEDGVPLNDALADLQDTILNGKDGVDGLTAAYDLFGKSGATVYEAIKNGTIDFQNLGNAASDAAGSVSETFEGTLDPIDKFQTALNDAKILGHDLAEEVQKTLAPDIEKVTNKIKDATEAFKQLTPEQKDMIIKIGLIAAVIGPAIIVIGALVTAIGAIVTAIGPVIAILTGPWLFGFAIAGAAIAAIIIIGKALIDNWDQIKADAIKFKDDLVKRFNEIKTNVSKAIEELGENLSAKWEEIKTNVSNKATEIKTNLTNKWTEIKTNVTNKITELKTDALQKFEEIKTNVTSKIETLRSNVSTKFESIRSTISDKINAAKDAVHTAIEAIKGFFNFHWELPHLALPHFSVSGSANPLDWLTEGVPHISVEWYKKAYDNPVMFTSPTILQTAAGLKGFGDGSGAEIVMGLNKLRELVGETSGDEITINVYAAPGQDVRVLAREVERELVRAQNSRSAVFA